MGLGSGINWVAPVVDSDFVFVSELSSVGKGTEYFRLSVVFTGISISAEFPSLAFSLDLGNDSC